MELQTEEPLQRSGSSPWRPRLCPATTNADRRQLSCDRTSRRCGRGGALGTGVSCRKPAENSEPNPRRFGTRTTPPDRRPVSAGLNRRGHPGRPSEGERSGGGKGNSVPPVSFIGERWQDAGKEREACPEMLLPGAPVLSAAPGRPLGVVAGDLDRVFDGFGPADHEHGLLGEVARRRAAELVRRLDGHLTQRWKSALAKHR